MCTVAVLPCSQIASLKQKDFYFDLCYQFNWDRDETKKTKQKKKKYWVRSVEDQIPSDWTHAKIIR